LIARTVPFRAAVATLIVMLHLVAAAAFGWSRFGVPFNRAPGAEPAFHNPAVEESPPNWNRLVVARWDSEHYINLALRGYTYCPTERIRQGPLPPPTMKCDLAFYPGYAMLGRAASLGGAVPIDYALLAVSLVSAWTFLFLWTGKEIVGALGLYGAYVSLAVWNAFTTAFALVTIQTEACVLALSLGAFVALSRRRLWLGAVLAGAASGMRISGAATSVAYVAALFAITWMERQRSVRPYVERSLMAVASGWGVLATMGFFWVRFHDPLLYVHAHGQSYGHSPSLLSILVPEARWILRSLDSWLHEGVWLFAMVLWLAAGYRAALRGFPKAGQVYWGVLSAMVLFISGIGSVSRGFAGMNRYLLLLLPAFFAIGKLVGRKPAALLVWLAFSLFHYLQVDLCFYIGDRGPETFRRCQAAQSFGR
jgi:hypothetical protein